MKIFQRRRSHSKPQAARPVLHIPRQKLIEVRTKAFAAVDELDSEIAVIAYCRRTWNQDRPMYLAEEFRVTSTSDFDLQSGGRIIWSKALVGEMLDRVRMSNDHLLEIHTHPPDSVVDFSTADQQSNLDIAIELQKLPGQRSLLVGVFNHFLSQQGEARFLHYQGQVIQSLAVEYTDDNFILLGKDYTQVGSLVEAVHSCPNRNWHMEQTARLLNLTPGLWKGEVTAPAYGGDKVWEDTAPEQVNVKVSHWPIECGCGLSRFKGKTVSLADLGYTGTHPWRSG